MSPRAARPVFVCQRCSFESARWQGQCPRCAEWNTLVETVPVGARANVAGHGAGAGQPRAGRLGGSVHGERYRTSIGEFDRVLGGGLVPGSVALLAGDPGVGKSTLILQVAAGLGSSDPVLYATAEESAGQVDQRARRLTVARDDLLVLPTESVEAIIDEANLHHPRLIVVDSIQTVTLGSVEGGAGSIVQVRESTLALTRHAKETGAALILIGHVTKDGNVAGPRTLEHIVDVVLQMEGDRQNAWRILRATKNRFGATDEIGVFAMEDHGLIEVPNPSAAFIAERARGADGSVIGVALEGSRPLLVEVQALTAPTTLAMPRRTANGLDINRVHLLVAVLQRRLGLPLGTHDVFANVIGGSRIVEPALDLALALAIVSSHRGEPIPPDLAVFGEIGLNGEVRGVPQAGQRVAEAGRLGFHRVIAAGRAVRPAAEVEVIAVHSLREAIEATWSRPAPARRIAAASHG